MNGSGLKKIISFLIPLFLAGALLMITVSFVRGQSLISSPETQSAGEPLEVPDSTDEPRPAGQNPGETWWYGEYFNSEEPGEAPDATRIDETIDFRWWEGPPHPDIQEDYFSVRWTGIITPPAGIYEFTMSSDDGSRLKIDYQLVMSHWVECCTSWQAVVSLEEGPHQVWMEMHEHEGAAWAVLTWQAVPPEFDPPWQDSLALAGTSVVYTQTLTNHNITGSFGLSASGNSWPTTFWDGATQISSTGTLVPDETFIFTVRVDVPAGAAAVEDIATIWGTSVSNPLVSASASLRTAVPASSWVQAFREGWAPDGSTDDEQYLDIVRSSGIDTVQVTDDPDWQNGSPALAAYPREAVVAAWQGAHYWNGTASYTNIEYAAVGAGGNAVVSVTQVMDNISATFDTYEVDPALAVSPADGNVLITWSKQEYDPEAGWLWNIYYAVRGPDGGEVLSPTALTTNTISTIGEYAVSAAAFGDGNFAVTWQHYENTTDVYYAVLDSAGSLVAGPVNLTGGLLWSMPAAANRLADGNVLLTWVGDYDNHINYAVLDSAGNVIYPVTVLVNADPASHEIDAVGLRNGNTVIAWEQWFNNTGYFLTYAVLDSTYEPLFSVRNPGEVGWHGEYYNNQELSGTAVVVSDTTTIDFDWGTGSPQPDIQEDNFSVRWTGTISLPAGTYHFNMGSDDGSRLWIDDQPVMDHWFECCTHWQEIVRLSDGPHQVRMEMHEGGGTAWAELTWGPILYNGHSDNNRGISLARDGGDNAVFTWLGTDWPHSIIYGLVDNTGSLRSSPVVFRTTDNYLDINQWSAGNGSLPEPALSITKSASPEPVAAGGLLTYTLLVENSGYADATGVTLTDTLPANTTFVSADSGGTLAGDQVQWTGLTVSAGGSLSVQLTVQVSDTLDDGSIIVNDDYGVKCNELTTAVMGEAVSSGVSVDQRLIFLPFIK